MAETVQFDLVSPERLLASLSVDEVQIPGADGDMTAMAHHAPLITTLRPGLVRATGREGETEYVVTGGFAEIDGESISVLAERAVARKDMTQEQLQSMVDEATEKLNTAKESHDPGSSAVDEATKLLSDMVAVGERIGMQPN